MPGENLELHLIKMAKNLPHDRIFLDCLRSHLMAAAGAPLSPRAATRDGVDGVSQELGEHVFSIR